MGRRIVTAAKEYKRIVTAVRAAKEYKYKYNYKYKHKYKYSDGATD